MKLGIVIYMVFQYIRIKPCNRRICGVFAYF